MSWLLVRTQMWGQMQPQLITAAFVSATHTGVLLIATCNQCYNCFTGLYLQVCKNRPIFRSFINLRVANFNMLMPVFTLKYQAL